MTIKTWEPPNVCLHSFKNTYGLTSRPHGTAISIARKPPNLIDVRSLLLHNLAPTWKNKMKGGRNTVQTTSPACDHLDHRFLAHFASARPPERNMRLFVWNISALDVQSWSHIWLMTGTFCHPGRSLHVFTNQHLKKWKPDDEPRLKSGKIHHLALRLRATHWVDLWPRAFCSLWIMSIVRYNLPLVWNILFYHYSSIFSSVICGVRLCWGLLWVSW